MRWFRSNRQFGARLALIAMAWQFLLTFGHAHVRQPTLAEQELAAIAMGSGGSGKSDRNESGLAELDCPVCALLHLSAASMPAVAPVLPLPMAAAFVTLAPHAHARLAAASWISQQARAPPTA